MYHLLGKNIKHTLAMNRLKKLPNAGRKMLSDQKERILERTFAGRLINMLKFIIVILVLGLWFAGFLAIKDSLFTGNITGNVLTDLTCITFFGGLIGSIIIGSLAGDIVRRFFWRMLVKYKK
jgi:hypothetical protein